MILTLDTTLGLSMALAIPGGSVQQWCTPQAKASNDLHQQVANLFTQSNTIPAQLRIIAVTVGPGSFTGIRLGLALAQSIQLVHPHIEVQGLCTLGTLALQHTALEHTTVPFTIVLDAAGGQAYTQTFDENAQPLTEASVDPLTEVVQTAYPIYHQASLLLSASGQSAITTFTHIEPEALLMAQATPHIHRPAQPAYLKPLTYVSQPLSA